MAERVLILGATGMLGHKVFQRFPDAMGTCRQAADPRPDIFGDRLRTGIDTDDEAGLREFLRREEPAVIINCVGIVKQRPHDPVASIRANSLLPHLLAGWAGEARLIHFSTDCVFSGSRGNYSETDTPDPIDLYGRSKLLGEVDGPALTIRTSIVGRELAGRRGLVEWLMGSEGSRVAGYRRAVFSGLTTNEMADVVHRIVTEHRELAGLYHVAGPVITKHDLLTLVASRFGLEVAIDPDDGVAIDRSLDGSRFEAATGYSAPTWPAMVEAMASDPTQYDHDHG